MMSARSPSNNRFKKDAPFKRDVIHKRMPVRYKIQTASDIIRDGLGIELTTIDGDVLAEIFRNDMERTLVVNTFENEIPLDALELLVQFARERLEPFEDGTAINQSKNFGGLNQG